MHRRPAICLAALGVMLGSPAVAADSIHVSASVAPVVTLVPEPLVAGTVLPIAPVAASIAAPPPVVVVTPVAPAAPAPRIVLQPAPGITAVPAGTVPPVVQAAPVVAAPVCAACDCSGMVALDSDYDFEAESESSIDLEVSAVFRNVLTEDTSAGGANFALRALLGESMSLEFAAGWLTGGTATGGAYDEVPLYVNVLWYPFERDWLSWYLATGLGATWTAAWRDVAQAGGAWDSGMREQWYWGGRFATGLELAFFDFLLLTTEVDLFARAPADGTCPDGADFCGQFGVSVTSGLGLRF